MLSHQGQHLRLSTPGVDHDVFSSIAEFEATSEGSAGGVNKIRGLAMAILNETSSPVFISVTAYIINKVASHLRRSSIKRMRSVHRVVAPQRLFGCRHLFFVQLPRHMLFDWKTEQCSLRMESCMV